MYATEGMKYGELLALKKMEDTDRQTFLDAQNRINRNLMYVYVSYDSTNFNTKNDYDGYSEYG